VQTPDGRSLLVDAGGSISTRTDIGSRVVAPALWGLGVRRLDVAVLTHGDPDHIGGLGAVLGNFAPREVWEGMPVPGYRPVDELRAAATDLTSVGSRSWSSTHRHRTGSGCASATTTPWSSTCGSDRWQ
jgi:competence protein ComEC